MKIYYKLLPLLLLVSFSLTLSAQVNVGSLDAPVKAGILQIKEHEPTDPFADNQTVSTGALALPRVKLKQLTSLSPLLTDAEIAAADYATQKKKHIGAMVFNTTIDAAEQLVLSVYVWDGEAWQLQRSDSAADFAVWADKNVLEFPSGLTGESLVAQNLTINRSPADVANQLSMDHILNGGVSYTPPATITANPTMLPILPLAMSPADIAGDPFKEKISNLNLTITDGASSVTQKIILRQIHYSIQITTWKTGEVAGDENEVNSGRSYTLKVHSNADWKVEIDDQSPFVALNTYPQDGVANVIAGESYNFQISNDDAHVGKIVKLTFKSQQAGKCKDVVVRLFITKEYPNAYIVDPATTSFQFPITKAFLAWEQDRDLKDTPIPAGAYAVDILWQDKVGMISNVALAGSDRNAQVTVTKNPGDMGNALVQFTIDGKVYWSWHLWITDYNPNKALTHPFTEGVPSNIDVDGGKVYSYFNQSSNTVLMDRSLGATTVELGKATTYGYNYQYGRKDPWPAREFFPDPSIIAATRSVNHIPVYAGLGSTLFRFMSINQFDTGSATNNLQYTVHNPGRHINAPINDNDWYSKNLGEHRFDLWMTEDGRKTVFDPCPSGWRIPNLNTGVKNILFGLQPKALAAVDGLDYTPENFGILPNVGLGVAYGIAGEGKFHNYSEVAVILAGANSAGAADMKGFIIPNISVAISMSQRHYATPVRCVRDESLNRK